MTAQAHAPPRALIVVAKAPAPGRTKTRLCPPLDAETAAALAACFLRDTLGLVRGVPGVRRTVAYLPEDAEGYFRALAPDMDLAPQRGADLGERLANLLGDALARGAGQAVVMASDSPSLPPAYLAAAFAALAGPADLVLGPCDDGGYYLLGLKRAEPRLLREVPLSTPTVARDTLALAEGLGLRAALLPTWYDVDTAGELARLAGELRAAPPEVCPATRRLLAQLGPLL
ncbi:MAG TPA: TIGR04282 family arsenosugar biosynthesis glycosyltransferase [Chloroflexaceae bacterium]|nr:TIGR04282 family arsenosugar biosynthesis glycosyltransferase [Chloroflexaceae bacterium]